MFRWPGARNVNLTVLTFVFICYSLRILITVVVMHCRWWVAQTTGFIRWQRNGQDPLEMLAFSTDHQFQPCTLMVQAALSCSKHSKSTNFLHPHSSAVWHLPERFSRLTFYISCLRIACRVQRDTSWRLWISMQTLLVDTSSSPGQGVHNSWDSLQQLSQENASENWANLRHLEKQVRI